MGAFTVLTTIWASASGNERTAAYFVEDVAELRNRQCGTDEIVDYRGSDAMWRRRHCDPIPEKDGQEFVMVKL